MRDLKRLKKKYPQRLDFAKKFNPDQLSWVSRNRKRLGKYISPNLDQIDKLYGKDFAIAWLMAHLQFMNETLNLPVKMNAKQIEFLATSIRDRHGDMSALSFMLFETMLIGGYFKIKHGDRITPDRIMINLFDFNFYGTEDNK